MSRPDTRTAFGPERILVGLYALFVVAAGARSAVQLSLHADRAPLAYALSGVAAVVYLAGFVLVLRASRGGSPGPARGCAVVELTGVLAVGLFSLAQPDAFPDTTVWSHFGSGYLFVPVLLPVAVLTWLRRR